MPATVMKPAKLNRVHLNPSPTDGKQPLVPHRWTIENYRELYKTGLFFDVKTMLLHGELFVLPLHPPRHDVAAGLTLNYARELGIERAHVRCSSGFDIGTHSDPGPDVAVVPGTIDDYGTKHPTSAILIVEVAVSSLATDLTVKAELYAMAEVPEYWVLDVEGRELHVFRDPVAQPEGLGALAYGSHQKYAAAESVSPRSAPTALVKIEDLLPKLTTH